MAYDPTGNRVRKTQHTNTGDQTITYTYQGHRLDTVTTTKAGVTTLDEYDHDPAGNTTSRVLAGEGQTLEWDAEGHLAKVTENGQETSYVYTADGQRLIRKEPQAVTLYLGNQEIRLDRTSRVKTGTRYYTHAGRNVAVRTQAALSWLATDHHGTGEVSINSVTLQVSRRRHLPFGEPRGTAPLLWPGERGFVGGTIDASTDLTHLGAREYDPVLGRFVSVDPVMDLTDPQQMNGYTYGNNNPVTFTDPSGLKLFEGDNTGAIDSGACRDGKCGAAPLTPKQSAQAADLYTTQTYLYSPVLGRQPDSNALDALRDRGYKGSDLFTRLEALQFAMANGTVPRSVCSARHAGLRSGGMGTDSDDIGPCEST